MGKISNSHIVRLLNIIWQKTHQISKPVRLLVLMFSLSVCMLQASNSYAQSIHFKLDTKEQSLGDILKSIENQSDYSFFYNTKQIDLDRKISLTSSNFEINEVLDILFKDTDITYAVLDKSIILTNEKNSKILGSQAIKQANKTITGIVTEAKDVTLPGVSVVIKGTTIGTTTDRDGKYLINVAEGQTLIFTFLGYDTQEVKVGTSNTINVFMTESNIALNEVVVTALGIRREQKTLSYNVQQVKNEDISTVKDPSFIGSLVGKVAGVNINSSSAGMGGASRVVMRGVKSIEQGSNALYVIDGIPIYNASNGQIDGVFGSESGSDAIADLNPDDIESMSVLSGASASALYGSQAANGVILITTKRGKEGKIHITYSNQTTFSNPLVLPKFQNTYDNVMKEYESWGDKRAAASSYRPKDFFNTGTAIQNSLTLSIGNEKNQTFASAAVVNTNGIIPNSGYDRQNYTIRNTTNFLNNKLTFDASFNYILQKDRNMMAQGQYFNPLTAIYTFPRGEDFDNVRSFEHYSTARNINVQNWAWGDQDLDMQNPYWVTQRNIFEHDKKRYMINASLKYDINNWLNVVGRAKVDNSNTEYTRKLYATTSALHTGGETTAKDKGFYSLQNLRDEQIYADVIGNMNKTFGDYSVNVSLGGATIREKHNMNLFAGRLNKIPNFFAFYNVDRTHSFPEQTGYQHINKALFTSAEVGWKNMLYFTATGRIEWDSAMKNQKKEYFMYPSVGLSAIVSEMVQLPSVISYMKIRGSYAEVANGIPAQLTELRRHFNYALWEYENYKYKPLVNPKNENTKSWEVGLDIRLLDNRLHLDATAYKSNTYNQTINVPISSTTGYNSMYIQTGNILNQGFEGLLSYEDKWGSFIVRSSFTASYNQNKVIDLGTYEENGVTKKLERISKGVIGSAEFVIKEGGSVGDFWGLTELQYDNNGNIMVDKDNELFTVGVPIDKQEKLGSVLPKWNLGFNNQFTWKGINLGVVISARLGGQVLSATQAILDGYGVSQATADMREAGGIKINNGTIDARTWYKAIGGKQGVYKYYVYDATNVRLQEISLGYTLPRSWFKDVVKVNVAFVGRNLAMLYNKAPFDPESTASTGSYYQGVDYFMQPSLRNLGFSIKLEY